MAGFYCYWLYARCQWVYLFQCLLVEKTVWIGDNEDLTCCAVCFRHAAYSHQYRAMFVMNCTPDMTEVLHHTMLTKKKKSNKRKRPQTEGQGDNCTSSSANDLTDDDVEVYHPVRCDLCKTEVAVYDKDEVFHFFNILSSY